MFPNEYSPFFKSALRNELNAFLTYKRLVGCKYETQAHVLERLDKYLISKGITELNHDTLLSWTMRAEAENQGAHYVRISVYRQFAKYLNRHDMNVPLPYRTRSTPTKSFTPYIFSKEQIGRILFTADNLQKACNSSRHLVMPVLLRLLYGCGLRVSEATCLRIKDVALERRLVTILHCKNDICRTIPMSESLCHVISKYLNEIYIAPREENFVFPTPKMEQHSASTIYQTFRKILWESDIPHNGRGKGPRLHDLRHTFAVHSLQVQIAEGRDTYLILPILSRYLGHKNIYETEKYLRLTAEMYPDILEKVQQSCGKIMPEVVDYETD